MTITATQLTIGGVDTGTSATTASISPGANKLILVTVLTALATTPATPTVTGCGMTWEQVLNNVDTTSTRRFVTYRTLSSSPGSGTLTIDLGGVNHTRIYWAITEFSGVRTSGSNGVNAIRQTAVAEDTATNTGLTVTLASFGSASNATYGIVRQATNTAISPGTGFTELGEFSAGGNIEHEFRDSNDTSVDWSWASTSAQCFGVALELVAEISSASASVSPSASLSPSASVSSSASVSPSSSSSASTSPSASISPSASTSPSSSSSSSVSPSASVSPSSSVSSSISGTPSSSPSPSSSTSPSASPSSSQSRSVSPSHSTSPSNSASLSKSPSPSPSPEPSHNLFTREAIVALPSGKADLAITYTTPEEGKVAVEDGHRVAVSGATAYLVHQFKRRHTNRSDRIKIRINARTTLAPTTETVYLQIWNGITNSWETLDSNSKSGANEDFNLHGDVSDTSYYDFQNEVCVRIYQNNPII